MYTIENYKNKIRFNEQYEEIYRFLSAAADKGYNEHYHWARFEWMMCHSFLETNRLPSITLFRDRKNEIVGLITYDTCYEDRTYIIHSISEKELLRAMVEYVIRHDDAPSIKVNSKDIRLKEVLQEYSFCKSDMCNCVLEFDLKHDLKYRLPQGYTISRENFEIDTWKYRLVIHKGFDNDGIPEKWSDDILNPSMHFNGNLKIFAIDSSNEYCSHCGIWYTHGETAYIEPVATIPQCRKIGLAKAVVYEALNRVKKLGAKRAVVISDQEFYYKIGFEKSSIYDTWHR